MTEPIIIDSDSNDSESLDALAEDRPPSDEDYQSSITLSSDDDEDDCEDDEEEDADNDDTKEEAANDEAAKEEADNTGSFYLSPYNAIKHMPYVITAESMTKRSLGETADVFFLCSQLNQYLKESKHSIRN